MTTGTKSKSALVVAAMLILAVVVGSGLSGNAQTRKKVQRKKQRTPTVGMKIKLDLAKGVLAGLANGNFETIASNAKSMQGLNLLETFARGKSRRYRTQLEQFQSATDQLVRAAKEKKLDSATLAYTQMTINCVNCHKELRR